VDTVLLFSTTVAKVCSVVGVVNRPVAAAA